MLPNGNGIRGISNQDVRRPKLSIVPGNDKFKMAHPCIVGYRIDSHRRTDKSNIKPDAQAVYAGLQAGFCDRCAAN